MCSGLHPVLRGASSGIRLFGHVKRNGPSAGVLNALRVHKYCAWPSAVRGRAVVFITGSARRGPSGGDFHVLPRALAAASSHCVGDVRTNLQVPCGKPKRAQLRAEREHVTQRRWVDAPSRVAYPEISVRSWDGDPRPAAWFERKRTRRAPRLQKSAERPKHSGRGYHS